IEYAPEVFGTGRLASREESKLSFKTGGIVSRIHVREGQQVRRGQLLAELDLDEIEAQTQQASLGVQQAGITLSNARLALERAERDYRNVQGLFADSVATLEQMEDAELQLRNARNQLEAAQTGLAYSEKNQTVADFNLKYSSITAPANGTILMKLAEVNELVGPGTPVFLFGSKEKAQVIRVSITDKDVIHVKLGDRATVEFDAYPGETFPAEVREIASMADPYTNTYEVELEIDPAGKILLSGFIGSVRIRTSGSESLIRIPVDALVKADGHSGEVFVVRAGRAELVNIEIHSLGSDRLLLRSGLQPGDEVIVKGGGYLEAKDSVLVGKPK
ncbi:MAG: efflux RND transporter periplasmic adaptor subunit, partial [Saprospiraceae bacterium]|nr:efflux RND transporter periplasmic adaptor subunit [Saprospiraceae bacterium]